MAKIIFFHPSRIYKINFYLFFSILLVSCAGFERKLPEKFPDEPPPIIEQKFKIEKSKSRIKKKPPTPVSPSLPVARLQYPLSVGERYVYRGGWSVFSVGTAVVEILPMVQVNGKSSYHIYVEARTNDFFSAIYNAEQIVEVFIDAETLRPYKMELKGRETKFLRHHISIFDYEKGRAYYWKKTVRIGKEKEPGIREISYDLKPGLFDALTPIFRFRAIEPKIGKKINFQVLENAGIYNFSCEILKQDKKNVLGRDEDAFYFECTSQRIVFGENTLENEPKNKSWGWISASPKRYIIEAGAEMKLGSVTLTLQEKNF